MRIVAVDELTAEMELARDIIDPETGRILLGSGAAGMVQYAERLRGAGIHYVYVSDAVSRDIEITPAVAEDIRVSAEQALDKVYEKYEIDQRPDYLMVKQMVQSLIRPNTPQPAGALDTLTPREMEILGHLAAGHSNKVIARKLDLAESTITVHVQSILRKLELSSRVQAAVYAVQHKVPQPND